MGCLYGDQRYLFILGHMRGYTTLLAHILGSHPRIQGYAEQHLSYDSLSALRTLRRRIAFEGFGAKREDGGYLLDKLLHSQLALAGFVSDSPNVRLVVTLREPVATVRSIRLLQKRLSEDEVVTYYTGRVAHLQTTVERLPPASGRALYLDAERLLDDTSRTLARLADFLRLDEPLSEHYDLFRLSGVSGFGDTSQRLRTGRIVREPKAQEIELSASAVQRIQTAYARGRAALRERLPQ